MKMLILTMCYYSSGICLETFQCFFFQRVGGLMMVMNPSENNPEKKIQGFWCQICQKSNTTKKPSRLIFFEMNIHFTSFFTKPGFKKKNTEFVRRCEYMSDRLVGAFNKSTEFPGSLNRW